MMGFCPFHSNKKTPSLVVWPGTQSWKCFGACDDGGDIFDWVLKDNPGWDFTEALRYLAKMANVTLTKASGEGLKTRVAEQVKADTLRVAQKVFVRWLVGAKGGRGEDVKIGDAAALAYAKDRGWTDRTIKSAGLGFTGRDSAAAYKDMRGEFELHGIDPDSPEAVMILGYRGDVKAWAKKHDIDPANLSDSYVYGLLDNPGLVYTHKLKGKIAYFSVRYLPGFDEKRKSHNPNSAIAGPRRPFFNWLHREHHSRGKRRGKRIFLVEGQGCAVTWGQFDEASMALCGSSWRYLDESGIVQMLKDEYEDIIYVTDADKPGQNVVTGKRNDFPLATAFGATLWVARTPAKKWTRPDGFEKKIGDTNDVAQYLRDTIEDEKERDEAKRGIREGIASNSIPISLMAAEYAGELSGQSRQVALRMVIPLITMMPNDLRVDYGPFLAQALYPELSKTKADSTYQKWIKEQLKQAAVDDGDDDDKFIKEESLGGWYPEDETENCGYLIDVFHDKKLKKIRFAYAHITDVEKNERQVVKMADYVIMGNKKIVPVTRPDVVDFLSMGAIRLPTGTGALLDSFELIKMRTKFYKKFFYMENESVYDFLGSYSLSTWVFDAFDLLTFLSLRGGSGSGKSDLGYLVGITGYRYAAVSAASTDASLRILASYFKALVMIDEVEEAIRKDDGALSAYIKASFSTRISTHMKTMEVMRADGRKDFGISAREGFHPMIFTGYKPFKDQGIENRCVKFYLSRVDMMTLDKHNIEPGYYPPEIETEAEEIRNASLHWRLATWLPKLELNEEQRKEYKEYLRDLETSARINSTLRPIKVLAILQNDIELLKNLRNIGRENYEDEMLKQSASFEALILRAIVAADIAKDVEMDLEPEASREYAEKVKEYAQYVSYSETKQHGNVRLLHFKDAARIANVIMDAENDNEDGVGKGKDNIKPRTIGTVGRDVFRFDVWKTNRGKALVLNREIIDAGKLRFGLHREAQYQREEREPEIVQDDFIF